MERNVSLSVCIIAKDEEKLLGDCIASVIDVADEIIVVDTGSTDHTIEIAKEYNVKIFEYPWDGSFSNARNFSIKHATRDWIMLLDADERFVAEDREKLYTFLETTKYDGAHFTIYNFVGEGEGTAYTLHNAFRLVRNNGLYMFRGEIHEQISRIEGETLPSLFAVLDVRLHHLGYLDWVVSAKDKRNRNIPMLQKQLEEDPNNSFTLFNLGNEYVALRDYEKAYACYQQSMQYYNATAAYSPHLYFRTAMCLYYMKRYAEAVDIATKALQTYPVCTDFEYFRGVIYFDWKRYTLAIDCFNHAMEMGEPPLEIRFSDDCATIKPLYSLGKLYFALHDYAKALDCFQRILQANSALYYILYDIGEILNIVLEDKNEVEKKFTAYFASMDHLPNLLVTADVFLKLGHYGLAEKYILMTRDMEGFAAEKLYLEGKYLLYTREYAKAETLLKEAMGRGKADFGLFPQFYQQCLRHIFAAFLLGGKPFEGYDYVQKGLDPITAKVYKQAANVIDAAGENELAEITDIPRATEALEGLLNILLKTQNFEMFEKTLYTYNYFETNTVLISLANVYLSNGYNKMAIDTMVRSINELGAIDDTGAEIMFRAFYC